MRREMVWTESQSFQGWACSDCAWVFNPWGAPTGESLEEMKQNFELRRDNEFAGGFGCTFMAPYRYFGETIQHPLDFRMSDHIR